MHGTYSRSARLRRYQIFWNSRYIGFEEGWNLTGRQALEIVANESFGGIKKFNPGNEAVTNDGQILNAIIVR